MLSLHKKNLIRSLVDQVYQFHRDEEATTYLESQIREAKKDVGQLEGAFSTLRLAFRSYLNSLHTKAPVLLCAFCKKNQDEVKTLVVGSDAAICDECARIALRTIERHLTQKKGEGTQKGFSLFFKQLFR